jgi:hypothetical protein
MQGAFALLSVIGAFDTLAIKWKKVLESVKWLIKINYTNQEKCLD